jgi:hypothetical protein
MIRTKSTLNRTVETVKKSSDTSSFVWLARNTHHVGEGGLRGRTPYFSTVDSRDPQARISRFFGLTNAPSRWRKVW